MMHSEPPERTGLEVVTVMLASGSAVPMEISEDQFEFGVAMLNAGAVPRFLALDGQEHLIPAHSIVYINRRTRAAQREMKAAADAASKVSRISRG